MDVERILHAALRTHAILVSRMRSRSVQHEENFPVASWLLPPRMRPHIVAVYHFARVADDFADEGALPPHERLALLDGWSERLHHAATSLEPGPAPRRGEPAHTVGLFQALGATIRACHLDLVPFTDLLSAFRQDVTTHQYDTWDEVFEYCRRSANPVGRIVLRVAGVEGASVERASDAVCTALQLTNFWQDLKIDFDRGRIYLPGEERTVHGATSGLDGDCMPGAWRAALAAATARTRALFAQGRAVGDDVRGRLRYELRATWLGGTRVLDRLEAVDFDVIRHRPTIGIADAPWLLWRMLTWTRLGP